MHHSLLQNKIVEQGFREFFKDDEQSGSHDSARIVGRRCARFHWRRGHFSADCRSVRAPSKMVMTSRLVILIRVGERIGDFALIAT